MRAHLRGQDDGLAAVRQLLERVAEFATLIDLPDHAEARHPEAVAALGAAEVIGRPLGAKEFVADPERLLGRLFPEASHHVTQRGNDRAQPSVRTHPSIDRLAGHGFHGRSGSRIGEADRAAAALRAVLEALRPWKQTGQRAFDGGA